MNTILKSLNIQKLHMKHLRAKTASNRWKTNSYYKEIFELTETRSLQLSFTLTLQWSVTTDTLKCSCSALSEKQKQRITGGGGGVTRAGTIQEVRPDQSQSRIREWRRRRDEGLGRQRLVRVMETVALKP